MRLSIKISSLFVCLLMHSLYSESQSITDSVFSIKEVKIVSVTPLEERGLIKTYIDNSVIQASLYKDLGSLMSHYSSLFVKSYGSGSLASASFRGTAASHTRVSWNGISLNNPMAGQVDFSLIPLSFVDEISILHGGSSLYDGGGALGGSIDLKTLPNWNDTLKNFLGQSAGSYGSYNTRLDIRTVKGNMQTRLRFYHERSDNDFSFYNDLNGEWNYEIQENAEYIKTGVMHEMHLRTKNKDILSLNTWVQKANRNFAPLMSYDGGGRKENQKDMDLRSSFIWKKYRLNGSSETILGWSHSNIDYHASDITEGGIVPHFDTENSFNSFSLKNKMEFEFKKDLLIRNFIDISYHDVFSLDKERLSSYDNHRSVQGNTLSIHKGIKERLSAYAMLRTEISDWKSTPLMPSLGLEINALRKENLLFRTNITRNFHLPTLNDLYWIPGGNEDLKPEQGYSSDLSIEYKEKFGDNFSLNTHLGAYYSLIDDWILWTPGNFGYWTAENMRKVSASGFEYKLSTYHQGERVQSSFFMNYSFTRTINLESSLENSDILGKQLIYLPLHKANSHIRLDFSSNYLSYDYSFIGRRYTTSSNDDYRQSLPAYGLHGLILGKEFVLNKLSYTVNLKINNLLNNDYQAVLERAMPGRNFLFTLNLNW